MIFVTLGTQDKSFIRLLKEIEKQISIHDIKDRIVVQAGHTKYQSEKMEIFDYIEMDQFHEYLEKSDLIITHGGVGSILTSLGMGKRVIAVARLQEFEEHENDHQVEIVSRFNELGYIIGCLQVKDLEQGLERLKTFIPNKYISNNEYFCNLIAEKIEEL